MSDDYVPPLSRERQIELMRTAPERHDALFQRLSDTPEFKAKLRAAVENVKAMTPEEREAMHEAQRASWLRGMAPCEHGMADYEQCPECRTNARSTRDE